MREIVAPMSPHARTWYLAAQPALAAALLTATPCLSGPVLAQDPHGEGHGAPGRLDAGVELTAARGEPGVITLRLGPLDLPSRSGHHEVAQPPDRYWEVSFGGWILSYAPRLVDGAGEPVPGRLLHHVAFWNTSRSDFLCPDKEEHIFGAGGEMNEWIELPGVGYRVAPGDRVRVSSMFHNPTDVDHPEVYLEVRVRGETVGAGDTTRRNVYPTWLDVQECGESDYDLAPGTNVTAGEIEFPVTGRLLGVGGHLHRYGKELVLAGLPTPTDAAETENEDGRGGAATDGPIARLVPETDAEGRILSMPIVPFLMMGGRRVEAGDRVRVTASYENPTGEAIRDGAMGIVVGYFLPEIEAEMRRFERKGRR